VHPPALWLILHSEDFGCPSSQPLDTATKKEAVKLAMLEKTSELPDFEPYYNYALYLLKLNY